MATFFRNTYMYIEQLRPARKIFLRVIWVTLLYSTWSCLPCVPYCIAWQSVQYMILFTLCTLLYCLAVCTVHDIFYLVFGIVLQGSLYSTWSCLPWVQYCTAWQSVLYVILFTLCTVLFCMAVCTVHDLVYLVYGIVLHGSLYFFHGEIRE